jgi:hypothetical protein
MLLIIFFLIIESQFCDDFVFEYEKKSSSPVEHWRIVVINEGRIIQNCEDYHLLLCIYQLVFVSCILSVAIF